MSETPRTDNAAGDGTTVPADFAADLERELAAMTAERDAGNAALANVARLMDFVSKAEAEVERLRERVAELEAAARLALNSMELLVTNFICDATHHAIADQHQWADCPIEVRFASAKEKLHAALKETK
jgi:hypothetical protein